MTTYAMHREATIAPETSAWMKVRKVVAAIPVYEIGVTVFWGAVITLDVALAVEMFAIGGLIGIACGIVWLGFGVLAAYAWISMMSRSW